MRNYKHINRESEDHFCRITSDRLLLKNSFDKIKHMKRPHPQSRNGDHYHNEWKRKA